jgi:hypothetical protein
MPHCFCACIALMPSFVHIAGPFNGTHAAQLCCALAIGAWLMLQEGRSKGFLILVFHATTRCLVLLKLAMHLARPMSARRCLQQ